MNKIVLIIALLLITATSFGQIQIIPADMPVSGDTLRYSIDLTSGATLDLTPYSNHTWNFSSLTPASQAVDTYKTALQVNPVYALTISINAYGYKTADSLPGLPVQVTNIYNFFSKKNSPPRFVIEGYAATVAGIPTPANYSDEDEMFFFPLDVTNAEDSSTFAVNVNIPSLGILKRKGYRKTKADGWGTIVTPYYTSPVNCLRTRSEVHEEDSITSPFGSFPLQLNSVEYKWLLSGQHYPALFVTTNLTGSAETVTNVRYRDSARSLAIGVINTTPKIYVLSAYPNPAINGMVTLHIPSDWNNYSVEVSDIQGNIILRSCNNSSLNLKEVAEGTYLIKVNCEHKTGYTFIKR
jgi:hypothetical protein